MREIDELKPHCEEFAGPQDRTLEYGTAADDDRQLVDTGSFLPEDYAIPEVAKRCVRGGTNRELQRNQFPTE
ncbi:hypothetical protein [Stratiformator vulcanicus]|uniref:Uncharacterized protein n=1 Tax=Stratiformator vulcanicus TaxID=2527980 RepID=A0A517R3W9_9PLAN|nr:hypothetical protein [Stratiformator vulcanicus]QDT38540.1 hypothetical protein Pan189_29340 [Stratiformator vulcanicus]